MCKLLLGQVVFEGTVPYGVNIISITAEYNRIYRKIAPQQRPDRTPLKIVFYSKADKKEHRFDLPEWGGGGAIGGNLIVIPTDFKPFIVQNTSQIAVHELVHAILYRAYPGFAIPRWFHEGVAMLLSGELSFEETMVVSKAIFMGRLMPLASVDSVNGFGRNRADLAYSQSHLAVLYLVEQFGIDVLPDILRLGRKTHNFWGGLSDATGLSSPDFEELTNSYLYSKYRLVFLVTDSYAWWVAVVLLFIAGFIVTSVRNRKRAAAMEAEENRKAHTLAKEAEEENDEDELAEDVWLEDDDEVDENDDEADPHENAAGK